MSSSLVALGEHSSDTEPSLVAMPKSKAATSRIIVIKRSIVSVSFISRKLVMVVTLASKRPCFDMQVDERSLMAAGL